MKKVMEPDTYRVEWELWVLVCRGCYGDVTITSYRFFGIWTRCPIRITEGRELKIISGREEKTFHWTVLDIPKYMKCCIIMTLMRRSKVLAEFMHKKTQTWPSICKLDKPPNESPIACWIGQQSINRNLRLKIRHHGNRGWFAAQKTNKKSDP